MNHLAAKGKAVVAKQKLIARRTILSHAQPGRRISPGEFRINASLVVVSVRLSVEP